MSSSMSTNLTNPMPTGTTNATNPMPTGTTNSNDAIKSYVVSLSCFICGCAYEGVLRTSSVYVLALSKEEAIDKASKLIDPFVFFSDLNLFLRD